MRDFTQYTHLRQSSDLNVDLDDRTFKEQDTFLPRSRDSDETREFHCEEEDTPFTHRSSAALVAHAVLLVCNTVILGLSVLLWLRGESNCPYGVNGPDLIRSMSFSTSSLPHSTPNMIIHRSHGRSSGLHHPQSHRRHKVFSQWDDHPRSTAQGVWSAWSGSGRCVVGNARAYVLHFSLLPPVAVNHLVTYPVSRLKHPSFPR